MKKVGKPDLALVLVLKVVESVAALALAARLEVGQEVIVGRVAAAHLLHGDELLVLDEEDAVAVPEVKIQFMGVLKLSIFDD